MVIINRTARAMCGFKPIYKRNSQELMGMLDLKTCYLKL